jgi:gamma-glutamyltranspeptidase/glutathione hydrolase
MVVTPEANASRIGAEVLRKGGNAVDATVAVAFALAVTNPQAGSLGGGGFAITRDADGQYRALDFRELAPSRLSADLFLDDSGVPIPGLSTSSGLGVGVPGLVAGLEKLHADGGSLPWPDLIQPAISLARDGFQTYKHLRNATTDARRNILKDAQATALFLSDDGSALPVGTLIRQPKLARSLNKIARRGARGFYHGRIAKQIARAVTKRGGVMQSSDLKRYKTVSREPLIGHYHDYRIISFPPPSSGGVVLLQILAMLDQQPELAPFGSARHIHQLAETERRAYADRSKWLGDPDFVAVPIERMLEPNYLSERSASIEMNRATPSDEIGPGVIKRESEDTLHFSIADAQGGAVAFTTTLNTNFGSAITAGSTGILLNNELDDFSLAPGVPNTYGLVGGRANAVEPNKRPLSSMTPTIVESPDHPERPYLVLGSPGGGKIISSVLQVILNVIDEGMDLQQAVDAARFHHQWLPDQIQCEAPCFSPEVRGELERLGHQLLETSSLGNVNAIGLGPNGEFVGAPDARRGAVAEAP